MAIRRAIWSLRLRGITVAEAAGAAISQSRRLRGALRYRLEKPLARLLAAAAALGADPTVLVLVPVLLALGGADAAGCPARLHLGTDQPPVRLGLA